MPFITLWTKPGHTVAGKDINFFLHTFRAYLKTALAGPAEAGFGSAEMTDIFLFSSFFGSDFGHA
jgi:hypothetical protein